MNWRWFHTLAVVVLVGVAGAAVWIAPNGQVALSVVLVALLGLFLVFGLGIVGRWTGAWIDERNKMTLSRLQLIIWTVVVLGGWLAAVLGRVATGVSDPLAVAVPEQMWLLLGISTASLIGSPLILGPKKGQRANQTEAIETVSSLDSRVVNLLPTGQKGLMLFDEATGHVRTVGQVEIRSTANDATWADLFRGDESGNAAWVDVGKVQMFLFTVVIVLAYLVLLFQQFAPEAPPTSLPIVPESMIALLGISHAGYLGTKAVSHSAPGG